MLFRKRKRVGQFVTVSVVVWRDDEHEMTVKENDDDGCSSDDVVLWLGRRQSGELLSGGENG
jgi:hypothetical protein